MSGVLSFRTHPLPGWKTANNNTNKTEVRKTHENTSKSKRQRNSGQRELDEEDEPENTTTQELRTVRQRLLDDEEQVDRMDQEGTTETAGQTDEQGLWTEGPEGQLD